MGVGVRGVVRRVERFDRDGGVGVVGGVGVEGVHGGARERGGLPVPVGGGSGGRRGGRVRSVEV